ncbi:hypothetical protein ABFC03_29485, partial [Klebsiella pneumoniae]|uniref:hypothetical protein n=2 Tax=Klebsiella pneumoniae TaxID=573 RepID=UPI00320F7B84
LALTDCYHWPFYKIPDVDIFTRLPAGVDKIYPLAMIIAPLALMVYPLAMMVHPPAMIEYPPALTEMA